VDPIHLRKLLFESGLEAKCLLVLMADPTVHEVREQQKLPSFTYGGRRVVHWVDFLVIRKNGWREARSIKYVEDQTADLRGLLEAAAEEVGDAFADDYGIMSELDITQTQLWNAAHIVSALKDADPEAQKELAQRLRSAPRQIRVGDCDTMLGDGVRGSRAAMALVKTGKLVIPPGQRLGRDTVLGNLFTN
jgi:hypothetical protein